MELAHGDAFEAKVVDIEVEAIGWARDCGEGKGLLGHLGQFGNIGGSTVGALDAIAIGIDDIDATQIILVIDGHVGAVEGFVTLVGWAKVDGVEIGVFDGERAH